MSYANTANRPNPAAILGALGVPGGIAVLLITGLAITGVIAPPVQNPIGVNIEVPKIEPITEPDPKPDTPVSNPQTIQEPVTEYIPTRPDSDFNRDFGPSAPVGTLPDLGSDLTGIGIDPVDFGIPTPPPTFDPIAAAPLGNPGRWITDSDYRSSWINRDYSGVAAFSLEIDARGRVNNCSITQSTGHAALDEATCKLLERRARFEPAKNGDGNAVSGTFNSSVNWKIPE